MKRYSDIRVDVIRQSAARAVVSFSYDGLFSIKDKNILSNPAGGLKPSAKQ